MPRGYSGYKNVFHDYGAMNPHKRLPATGSHMGICPACGARRRVSKSAWFRRTRPACSNCGASLELSAPGAKDYFSRPR